MAKEPRVPLFAHNLWQKRLAGLGPQQRDMRLYTSDGVVTGVCPHVIEEQLTVFVSLAAGTTPSRPLSAAFISLGLKRKAVDHTCDIDVAMAQIRRCDHRVRTRVKSIPHVLSLRLLR